jgi:hypothetical protein
MPKRTRTYRISLIVTVILLIFSIKSFAQKEKHLYDTDSKIEVRTSDEVKKLYDDEAFNYNRKFAEPPENLLDRLFYWLSRFFTKVSEGGLTAWIFYGVLVLILIVVLMQLLGYKYDTLFLRNKKMSSSEIEVFDENIHSLDINDMIQKAIREGDFRKAVRYAYLKLLKTLDNNQLIEWKADKTNHDYFREMRASNHFDHFTQLTRTYEYVWYGEFDINKAQFDSTYSVFEKVYKDLNEK